MTTQRQHTVTITGSSTISLGDLRWLVAQLAAASDNHAISISYSEGNQFESTQSSLSTTVPDAPAAQSTKKPAAMRTPNMVVGTPNPPNAGTWRISNGYDEAQMEQQNER